MSVVAVQLISIAMLLKLYCINNTALNITVKGLKHNSLLWPMDSSGATVIVFVFYYDFTCLYHRALFQTIDYQQFSVLTILQLDGSLPANPVNDRRIANAVMLKSTFCLP